METGERHTEADLRRVEWRDLVALTPPEVVRELLLPLPWLAGSLAAAECSLYPLALAFSFVFFLAGLRVVHGACHYAIGLPRRANRIVLFVLSLVMLGSMHAVRWNHLRHHRHICRCSHAVYTRRCHRCAGRWCGERGVAAPIVSGSPLR